MLKKNKEIIEWVQAIAIAILLSFFIRFFLFEVILVEGSSMLPTLEEGDRLIVSKIEYRFQPPQAGDIIVFSNSNGLTENYIKRVMGIAGDEVEIQSGIVYVNDQSLTEFYILEPVQGEFSKVLVSAGTVFVLGDNRNHSRDSRNPYVGLVPIDDILGKARMRIWPVWNISWFD